MKLIGVLGGASWLSTVDYYRTLNRLVVDRLGGYHSARICLYSVDYHSFKILCGSEWDRVPTILQDELERLVACGPDCILIANNALHKALDYPSCNPDFSGIPLIHIVDETARAALKAGCQTLLLLGTKFTMEDGYYADRLSQFGLRVEIPEPGDRDLIQDIQTAISAGQDVVGLRGQFADILSRYSGAYDAVVLGCTELPLVVTPDITDLAILNPTQIQCEAAVRFSLGA